MKGKVVKMNNSTKEVEIEVRGKIEKHIVGKAIFNQKKFQEGDNIEYNLKGKNFEFLKKISGEEMGNKQNNFLNNRNNKNFSKNNNSKEPVKVKQYPYNFVSFKDEKDIIDKGKRKLGTNTGKLVCKLVNRTPLFVMGESEQDNNGHTKEWFYREKGIPAIPASSLKGAVRNVIDVLTNSVIRNVEDEKLEQRIGAGKFESVFGIIESLPENGKNGVIIEAERIKVKTKEKIEIGHKRFNFEDNGKEFSKKYNNKDGLIERVKLKDSIYKLEKTKIQIKNKVTVVEKLIRTSEEYKKFLTDDEDENGVQGVLWFSSPIHGKIYEKLLIPKKNGKKFEFSQEEYQDFEYIINQRKDRIKNGKEKGISSFYYDKGLEVGDPVLFQVENGERAEHLAFSEIPRLRYKFSPLDLVPKEFRPSDSLDNLSFSERLFGTIGDNTKKEEGKKEELVALSGRVFFEDAKNYKPEMIDNGNPVTLKAFGEPHPTLTTFYLDNIEKNYNENKGVSIRGRKFYWHHKEKIGKLFSEYRKSVEMPKDKNGQNKFAYNSSLELMDINNEFEFNVNFENLTDEELGVLIYAIELEDGLLHKVGKGKAFGFGSCKIEIKEFLLENKDKYKDFLIEPFEKESKKEDYINKAKEKRYFDENRKNIKELKAILSKTNDLDFSESSFPEDINKKGETNSLNWFVNNKKGDRKIVLLSILDKNPK
ncbi:TIGR03986 family type III CRISPR-associated RAMP protein [Leptotrichia trevisanii]|uniref:TIGR03986 family type III CRISPR-associated RAMP protein n=1 Tax=Leptotrichia trevisanii TaxID=109328 RepID=UPI0004211656|nr:TIGR03986 family CRISPR-associated RAMP protein [Leptotrichia trevisanii]